MVTSPGKVPPSTFKVGDRVRIVGSHPWSGHTGTISAPLNSPDLDWIVSLEASWSEAAAADRDLRHAAR